MQARAVAVGAELLGKRRGAGVERLDAEQRRAGAVEQIEAVAVAGAADRGDGAGIDAGLRRGSRGSPRRRCPRAPSMSRSTWPGAGV